MHEAAAAAVQYAPDNNDYRYFAAMTSLYALIDAAHQGDQDRMKELGQESMDQLETILEADPDHNQARYLLVQQSVEMAPEVGLEVDDPEARQAARGEGPDPGGQGPLLPRGGEGAEGRSGRRSWPTIPRIAAPWSRLPTG